MRTVVSCLVKFEKKIIEDTLSLGHKFVRILIGFGHFKFIFSPWRPEGISSLANTRRRRRVAKTYGTTAPVVCRKVVTKYDLIEEYLFEAYLLDVEYK
jgi:hypothetical protein